MTLGVLFCFTAFPFVSSHTRQRMLQRWSLALLHALGFELAVEKSHDLPGALLVANHVSWIDIFVINAVFPSAFISKEEVRHWPIAGWLAAKNDTVFLRRGSRGHARMINEEIAGLLGQGRHVAVFPEGTTTDGTYLLHFHAALIQPALSAGHPVLPVAISYWAPNGERSLAPRYDGDISLRACLQSILGRQRLVARLVTTPPLGLNGEDRRQVATAARLAIASAAGLPEPSNPPGLFSGPQAEVRSADRPIDSRSPAPADCA